MAGLPMREYWKASLRSWADLPEFIGPYAKVNMSLAPPCRRC
jgi:hypothetical protein